VRCASEQESITLHTTRDTTCGHERDLTGNHSNKGQTINDDEQTDAQH
jgi:hypothetical protein